MGMKKATKDRINAAYDRGFTEGEKSGYERAKAEFEATQDAELRKSRSRTAFTDSLDGEADPE